MDVKEVLLPGVGLRYEFDNSDGDRIGVVAKRTGDFEVVLYAAEDLDVAHPCSGSPTTRPRHWRRSSAHPGSPNGSPT